MTDNHSQGQSADAQSEQSLAEDQATKLEPQASAEEIGRRLKATAEEAKKYRQANAEMRAKLEQIEREKLEAQGKWQEAAKLAEERAKKIEKEHNAFKAQVKLDKVHSQVKEQAARAGCVDTNALLKLVNTDDLQYDDFGNVDADEVKALIESAQKEKAYLFQKNATQPKDLPPAGGGPRGKALSDLSPLERIAAAAEMSSKKR